METLLKSIPATIVFTVGTSLLTGYQRRGNEGFSDFYSSLESGAKVSDQEIKKWHKILSADLSTQACAELASTDTFVRQTESVDYSIRMIVTDTASARFVKDVLLGYYNKKNIDARAVIADGLYYDDTDRFSRIGFPALINRVKNLLDEAKDNGRLAIINATPGFKAETSILTLMGALLDTRVFYMHERMKQAFLLPAMPVQLRQDFWDSWKWIIKAVRAKEGSESGTMPVEEFNSYLKSQANAATGEFLFEEFDNGIILSTLGHVFAEAYSEHTEESLPVSEVEKNERVRITKVGHHFPKHTKEIAEKLAELNFIERISTKEFRNTLYTRVLSRFDEKNPGEIFIQWADSDFAVLLVAQTTARNAAEHSFACNEIRSYLELESVEAGIEYISPSRYLQSNAIRLIDKLDEYGQQMMILTDENKNLKNKVADITKKLQEFTDEVEEKTDDTDLELQRLQFENTNLNKQLDSLAKEMEGLNNQINSNAQLNTEFIKIQEHVQKLEKQLRRIETLTFKDRFKFFLSGKIKH